MKFFYCLSVLAFSFIYSTAQIKYVTQNGSGNKNGTSWQNAWSGKIFSDTIYSVTSGTEVWIAKGIYAASKDRNGQFPLVDSLHWSDSISAHRETTFRVNTGVKIRGGFSGTESTPGERIDSLMFGVNLTYLDAYFPGDTGPLANGSNSLITLQNVSDLTLIEGFYLARSTYTSISVESSGSNHSSPQITKCLFGETWSYGLGPVAITANGTALSIPKIFHCYFVGGWGDNGSGGVYATGNCRLMVANSIFTNCEGVNGSAIGMLNTYGGDISNCTFYNNRGGFSVSDPLIGAIGTKNVTDAVNISNCIFSNNTNRGVISNLFATGTNFFLLNDCLFQAQDPAYTQPFFINNSFDAQPSFKNPGNTQGADGIFFTSDDGLYPNPSSYCINKGNNNLIPSFIVSDILGKQRVEGCRVDIGAFEVVSNTVINNVLPASQVQTCTQYPVSASGTSYLDTASCSIVSTIAPSGNSPVQGIIKVCVSRQSTVPVIAGIPYVQRFYDIEPLKDPSVSTSTLTLYYTQEEFDNYNTVAAGFPKLPVSATDLQGIANVRIQQDHGFSLTGEPGSFNGTTVFIDPLDANIVWNGGNMRWEVTFDVTGFSGFFVNTVVNVLPVSLLRFYGKEKPGEIILHWETENEMNASHFEILRSNDASNYNSIGRVNAQNRSNGATYDFKDPDPLEGGNFYKLLIVDKDNSQRYSPVLKINRVQNYTQVEISPNPAIKQTKISVKNGCTGKVQMDIYDIQGKKVKSVLAGNKPGERFSTTIDVEGLNSGLYILQCLVDGKFVANEKLFVQ